MFRRTVKLAAALVVAALATAGLAACSADSPTSSDGEQKSVTLVVTQKAGDQGPVDDMIASLEKLGADKSVRTKVIEATDPSAYESTLRTLGNAKTDVVITTFAPMQEPIKSVAPDFPDTRFVLLFGDPIEPTIANVRTVSFDIYKGMYISGALSATLSGKGTLGWVGGATSPTLNADCHAYKAGAKSVSSSVKVTCAYVGSFDNPAKGRDITDGMLSGGADIIQSDAGGSSQGVIQAAEARGNTVVADSSGEIAATFPKTVMATSFLKFGLALTQQASEALESNWNGGAVEVGLKEGIVGLTFNEPFFTSDNPLASKAKDAQQMVKDLQAKIIDGTVEVPFDTSGI